MGTNTKALLTHPVCGWLGVSKHQSGTGRVTRVPVQQTSLAVEGRVISPRPADGQSHRSATGPRRAGWLFRNLGE